MSKGREVGGAKTVTTGHENGIAAGNLVTARDLNKTYRPRHVAPTVALRGVSLDLRAGEAVAVVGPSGCGKSTLLSLIGTLDAADSGTITVLGQDIARMSRSETADLRCHKMGFVFQQYHLLAGMTVLENLLARYIGRRRPAEVQARAEALLDEVGLSHKKSALPRELSGGEQQRVCVARALLAGPELILADEPTGNLDSDNGTAVLDLMLALVRHRGAGLLLVTHDRGIAASMDRVVEMHDGLVVNAAG
jgi:putative ABC transport system ATP-binding protein